MSTIETGSNYVNSTSAYNQESKVTERTQTSAKKSVKGQGTYGDPKLSDDALSYYKTLKEKFGNVNFVLVASDKKEEAEAMKAGFATPGQMTVLIDEEKIEKMAADEEYRNKIEGVIANATNELNSFADQVASTGAKVSAYGVTIDDNGTAKYFAVLEESSKKQRERIEAKAEEKREQRIEDNRKAEREKAKERLESGRPDDGKVTLTANSVEELLAKISEHTMNYLTDNIMTEEEKMVGQSFDFSV